MIPTEMTETAEALGKPRASGDDPSVGGIARRGLT